MTQFINFGFKLVIQASKSGVIPAALIVSSFNMLLQILFSACFGSKGLPKIRGYRGE